VSNINWINFYTETYHRSHYYECEDKSYWRCPSCNGTLVPDSVLNYCYNCLKFIPRKTDCVCEELLEVSKQIY